MTHSSDLSRARPVANAGTERETVLGHRGLQLEEPLLFEIDNPGASGVDLRRRGITPTALAGRRARAPSACPA